ITMLRWLVYVGNISYVLYLVHWPVIVLVHACSLTVTLSTTDQLVSLMISLVVAICVHHSYENQLLTRSFRVNFSVASALYILTLISLAGRLPQRLSNEFIHYRQRGNATLYRLMEWNHRESESCCNTVPVECVKDNAIKGWDGIRRAPEGSCISHSNGTLSVLVVGNSVTKSSFNTVFRAFNGRFSTMRLFAREGCYILLGMCDDLWPSVIELV
ncbi:hypothetical protein PENTCL1PPCAC_15252, partial [Pristionchus entomophagus]